MAQQKEMKYSSVFELEETALKAHISLINALDIYLQKRLQSHNLSELQQFFQEKLKTITACNTIQELSLKIFESEDKDNAPDRYPALYHYASLAPYLNATKANGLLVDLKLALVDQLKNYCQQKLNEHFESQRIKIEETCKKLAESQAKLAEKKNALQQCTLENAREEFKKLLKTHLAIPSIISSDEICAELIKKKTLADLLKYILLFDTRPELKPLTDFIQQVYLQFDEKAFSEQIFPIIDEITQTPKVEVNAIDPSIREITGHYILLDELFKKHPALLSDNKIEEIRITATGTLFLNKAEIKLPSKNLIMIAPKTHLLTTTIIDTSGKDADPAYTPGTSAKEGKERRAFSKEAGSYDGESGQHGNAGHSAGNVHIETYEFIGLNHLTLKLNGGNGEDGQNGGRGDDGEKGVDGKDGVPKKSPSHFTRGSSLGRGTSGTSGKQGGNGGRGGLGGQGGHAGKAKIKIGNTTHEIDKNSHVSPLECSVECIDGKEGNPGKSGDGGDGGAHGKQGVDHGIAWRGCLLFINKIEERGKLLREKITTSFFSTTPPAKFTVIKTADEVRNSDTGTAQKGNKSEIMSDVYADKKYAKKLDFKSQQFHQLQQTAKQNAQPHKSKTQEIAQLESEIASIKQQESLLQSQETNLRQQITQLETFQNALESATQLVVQQITERKCTSEIITTLLTEFKEETQNLNPTKQSRKWTSGHAHQFGDIPLKQLKQYFTEELTPPSNSWFSSAKPITIKLDDKLRHLWRYLTFVRNFPECDADAVLELLETGFSLIKNSQTRNAAFHQALIDFIESVDLESNTHLVKMLQQLISTTLKQPQHDLALVTLFNQLIYDDKPNLQTTELTTKDKEYLYNLLLNTCKEIPPYAAIQLLEKAIATDQYNNPNNALSHFIHQYSDASSKIWSWSTKVQELNKLIQHYSEVNNKRDFVKSITDFPIEQTTLYRHFFNRTYSSNEFPFDEALAEFNSKRNAKTMIVLIQQFSKICDSAIHDGTNVYQLQNQNVIEFLRRLQNNIHALKLNDTELEKIVKLFQQLIAICQEAPSLTYRFCNEIINISYSAEVALFLAKENNCFIEQFISKLYKESGMMVSANVINNIKLYLERFDHLAHADRITNKALFIDKIAIAYCKNTDFANFLLQKNELINEATVKLFLTELEQKNSTIGIKMKELLLTLSNAMIASHSLTNNHFSAVLEFLHDHFNEIDSIASFQPFMHALLSTLDFISINMDESKKICAVAIKFHNLVKSKQDNPSKIGNGKKLLHSLFILARAKYKENILKILDTNNSTINETIEACLEEIDDIHQNGAHKNTAQRVITSYDHVEKICDAYRTHKLTEIQLIDNLKQLPHDTEICLDAFNSQLPSSLITLIKTLPVDFEKYGILSLQSLRLQDIDLNQLYQIMAVIKETRQANQHENHEESESIVQLLEKLSHTKIKAHITNYIRNKIKISDDESDLNKLIEIKTVNYVFEMMGEINDFLDTLDEQYHASKPYHALCTVFEKLHENTKCDFRSAYLFEISNLPWNTNYTCLEIIQNFLASKACSESSLGSQQLRFFLTHFVPENTLCESLTTLIIHSDLDFDDRNEMLEIIKNNYFQTVLQPEIQSIDKAIHNILQKSNDHTEEKQLDEKAEALASLLNAMLANHTQLNFEQQYHYFAKYRALVTNPSIDLLKEVQQLKADFTKACQAITPDASLPSLNEMITQYNKSITQETILDLIYKCLSLMLSATSQQLSSLEQIIIKCIKQLSHFNYEANEIDQIKRFCMPLQHNKDLVSHHPQQLSIIERNISDALSQLTSTYLTNIIDQQTTQQSQLNKVLKDNKINTLTKINGDIESSQEAYEHQTVFSSLCVCLEKMELFLAKYHFDIQGETRKQIYTQLLNDYETLKQQRKFTLKNCITQLEIKAAKLCETACIIAVLPHLKLPEPMDDVLNGHLDELRNNIQLPNLITLFKHIYNETTLPNREENLKTLAMAFTGLITTSALPQQKTANVFYQFLETELSNTSNPYLATESLCTSIQTIKQSLKPLMFYLADEELNTALQEIKHRDETTGNKIKACHHLIDTAINQAQIQIRQLEQETAMTIPIHPLITQLRSDIVDKLERLDLNEIEALIQKTISNFWTHALSQLIINLQSKHTSIAKLPHIPHPCPIALFMDLTKRWCNHITSNNETVHSRDHAWIRGMLALLSLDLTSFADQDHATQLMTLFNTLIETLDFISNKNTHATLASCLPELTLMIHQIFLLKMQYALALPANANHDIKEMFKMTSDKIARLITAAPTLKDGYIIANQLLESTAKHLQTPEAKRMPLKKLTEKINHELALSLSQAIKLSPLNAGGAQSSDQIINLLKMIIGHINKTSEQCDFIIINDLRMTLNCINLANLSKSSCEKILLHLEETMAAIANYCDITGQACDSYHQQQKLLMDTMTSLKEKIYGYFENNLSDHEKSFLKRVLASNTHSLNYAELNPLGKQELAENSVMSWLLSSALLTAHEENRKTSLKEEYAELLYRSSDEALAKFKEQFIAFYTPLLEPSENTFLLQIIHNFHDAKQFQSLFNIFQITSPDTWSYHLQQLALNMTHEAILTTARYDYALMDKLFNEIKADSRHLDISAIEWSKSAKQIWRLFNQYECEEQDALSILNFLSQLSKKATSKAPLVERIQRLQKYLQRIIKVKIHFNKALSFAEDGDYLAQLFDLINTSIHKNTTLSTSQTHDERFLDLISDILFECEDSETTDKAIEIISLSQPHHWKKKLTLYRLDVAVDDYFNVLDEKSDEQKLYDIAKSLINKINHSLPTIKILTKKLTQENHLMDTRAKITPQSLINILQLLTTSSLDQDSINALEGKSLSQWKLQLRLNGFSKALKISNVATNPKRLQCISMLGQLEKRYGETLIDQLLDILTPKKIEYNVLSDVLDHFMRAKYIFDSEAINKISTVPFNEWQTTLKNYTDISQAKERNLEDLLDLFKVEPIKEKPEEITQYTKDLLSFLEKKLDATKTALLQLIPLDGFPTLPVNQWDVNMIKTWAKRLKADANKDWIKNNIAHVVAVLYRAVELSKLADGYGPRDTQLLALWSFLEASQTDKGRLGQIATGEGKTVITAMFAAFKALAGENVDVITSSSVLAERDAKANENFFKMFKLKVANNCDEACIKASDVRRQRYKAHIVYGDVGSFQRDILLNDFHGQQILGDRKETTLLVDEVDSMLIDKSENMLYLSHDIADLRHLRHVYIKIWELVNAPNIDQYSRAERIDIVADHVNRAIDNKIVCIPVGLKEFVEQRLRIWIKSAFAAKNMKPKGPYITSTKHNKSNKNKVIVMDNDTGVEQLQTQWSNGLHQFLQLKHTQEISDESLKAIFISNISYFKKYKNKIYGLTGTLGSATDRSLLKQMYQVDFFQLPRYKANLFVEDSAIVTSSEHSITTTDAQSTNGYEQSSSKGWYEAIENEIKHKTQGENARAVLVICEDIDHVDNIVEHMQKTFPDKKLHVYKTAYEKFEIGSSKETAVNPGDIIIATNLAGRGTDLITSDNLEKNGGLHVVLSYLPPNTRIEEQAFGRTARQGKHGSGRYIVLSNDKSKTIEQLKANRDETEQNNIDKIRMQNLESILLEETLLESFKKLYQEVRLQLENKYKLSHGKNYVDIQLKSLNDHWAFWIDSMADKIKVASSVEDKKRLQAEFKPFEDEMRDLLQQDNIVKLVNSNHELIKLGHHFLSRQQYSLAQQCYDKVIATDKEFSEIAHYYKAYTLAQQQGLSELTHRKAHYKHLASARKLIKKRIDEITASNEIVSTIAASRKAQGHVAYHNEYQDQASHEITLLNVHMRAIDEAIGSELTEESFTQDPKLKDKEKSKKIFHKLRSNPTIFKDFRLSKKVSYNKECQLLHVTDNGDEIKVDIPTEYAYCKTKILDHLNKIIEMKNATAQQRSIDELAFVPYVLSKDQLWQLLKQHELLKNESSTWIILNPDQALKKLDVSKLGENGKVIHNILYQHLYKQFEKSLFPHMDAQSFDNLRKFLEEQKIIKSVPCADLKLEYDSKKQSIVLPPALEQHRKMLSELVQMETTASAKTTTLSRSLNLEELPLRDSPEEASRALWHYLISQDVIKPCKINFQLALSANSSKIEEKLNSISKQLKTEINQLYGKEGSDYAEPVLEILKRAIGKLKTIQKLNINFQNLDQYFLKGDYPPELETFTKIVFDKVLCFEEKPSYWNWHAFAIAMFGLAQIITGVLLEVFSVGAGTPISAILIGEGISDIIFAIHAGLTNSFSWKQYGIHKLTSVVCTTLTFGLFPPAAITVPAAATSTVLGFMRYAGVRVLQESLKAVAFGLVGFAIDKAISILPYELNLHIGKFLREKLVNSSEIKESMQQLKKTMGELLSLSNVSDTIKQEIQVEMLELLNPKQTWKNHAWSTVEGIAKQIPDALLSAKGQSLKQSYGIAKAILIEETIKLTLQSLWASGKCYYLIKQFASNIDQLNDKLQNKIQKLKQDQSNSVVNPLSEANQQFIDKFVDTQRDELISMLTRTLSDEVAKPLVNRTVFRAVNHLAEYWNDLCHKAAGCETKDEIQARTLRNRQQVEDDIPETQNKPKQNTQQSVDIDEPAVEMVSVDSVDPTTEISNAENMTLKDAIETSGKENIRLYKNAKGEIVMQESSTRKFVRGARHKHGNKHHNKGEHKHHRKGEHKHHRHNDHKHHSKNSRNVYSGDKHKHSNGHDHHHHHKHHTAGKHSGSKEHKPHHGRHHHQHQQRVHHSYTSSSGNRYKGRHHFNRNHDKQAPLARNSDFRTSELKHHALSRHERNFDRRSFRNRGMPLRGFVHQRQHFTENHHRATPISRRMQKNGLVQKLFTHQTLNIICNLVKAVGNTANQQINQYYQHRVRAIEIEMLKDKIASYQKLKQQHEIRKQEESVFIAKQKIEEIEIIETQLKEELKKRDDEITLLQEKIKELLINKLKSLQSNGSNDKEILILLESELCAIKALNKHVPCGGQSVTKFNEAIAAVFKNLSAELAGIEPAKILSLQQLADEIKPLEKSQSDLEEQLNIVLSAQKIAASGKVADLENYLLKNKISLHFQKFLPQHKHSHTDEPTPPDMNEFITQSNFLAASSYQFSSFCQSNSNAISSFANVFETVCSVIETKYKYDTAKINIKSKETERTTAQTNANSLVNTASTNLIASRLSQKEAEKQTALNKEHAKTLNADQVNVRKQAIDQQRNMNQAQISLHKKRLKAEHAEHTKLMSVKQHLSGLKVNPEKQSSKENAPNHSKTY